MSHRIILATLVAAAIGAPALSAPIVVTGHPASFRDLEYRYSGQDSVDAARTALAQAIPVGSSVADARILLKRAGAHCGKDQSATLRCSANALEASEDHLHDVSWTVDVRHSGDRVDGITVDRASIGS